jgi:hypothetical protein
MAEPRDRKLSRRLLIWELEELAMAEALDWGQSAAAVVAAVAAVAELSA